MGFFSKLFGKKTPSSGKEAPSGSKIPLSALNLLTIDRNGDMITVDVQKDVFLIPFGYSGEGPLTAPDTSIHCTGISGVRIMEGARILALDGVPEGYAFYQGTAGTMHFQTIMPPTGQRYMPLFTRFDHMFHVYGRNIRVAAITLDDTRKFMNECDGVVIAPGSLNRVIPREQLI